MRVGTVSIERHIRNDRQIDFDTLWNSVGKNTGNLMFTEAMYRVLDADVVHLGFSFDPEVANSTLDAVVIPAANWLGSNIEWDWLTDQIERLKIPVILVGIGLQASELELGKVRVSESALRLVRVLSEKAPAISVRGNFTKEWLASVGVRNVVTTGCPSIYMNAFSPEVEVDRSRFALQATRYFASKAFIYNSPSETQIFRLAAALGAPMIYQSEAEELQYLLLGTALSEMPSTSRDALRNLYGVDDDEALDDFLSHFGKAFLDLSQWALFVAGTAGVVGSRLHGSIIALNSGASALLHCHDSRTHEIADFAKIPRISSEHLLSLRTKDDVLASLGSADVELYRDTRSVNQVTFKEFLNGVGLPPRHSAMF